MGNLLSPLMSMSKVEIRLGLESNLLLCMKGAALAGPPPVHASAIRFTYTIHVFDFGTFLHSPLQASIAASWLNHWQCPAARCSADAICVLLSGSLHCLPLQSQHTTSASHTTLHPPRRSFGPDLGDWAPHARPCDRGSGVHCTCIRMEGPAAVATTAAMPLRTTSPCATTPGTLSIACAISP